MKTMKSAVIFDLDGTLWDASDTISAAWTETCARLGINRSFSPDDCRSFCGMTLEQIAALVFPDAEAQWAQDVIRACCRAECPPLAERGGRLFLCETDVLGALQRRYFLAVVSNCQKGYVEAFFTGNKTGRFFGDFENAERTGLSKAENIRLVMERNGIEHAIYVGDTVYDEQAAREAGVPFVYASYGYGEANNPDAVVSTFFDLLPTAMQLLDLAEEY